MDDLTANDSEQIQPTVLPPELRSLLKRKSSRDPNSRFSNKLFYVLKFTSDHPDQVDAIGAAWESDEEFRMNKKTLANVMGIRLNTLNVNLRDLGFCRQQRNHDGWTWWKKSGFTRLNPPVPEANLFGDIIDQSSVVPANPIYKLGKISQNQLMTFHNEAISLWEQITGSTHIIAPSTTFIENAAKLFKQPEQPVDNANAVISAIIETRKQGTVRFIDFCHFLAMFGPKETVMVKIANLLICSRMGENSWLVFGEPDPVINVPIYGSFLANEPNCLRIRLKNQIIDVWNDPLTPSTQYYVIDSTGMRFRDWEQYFTANPVIPRML